MESTRCVYCGRELTAQKSIERGAGLRCACSPEGRPALLNGELFFFKKYAQARDAAYEAAKAGKAAIYYTSGGNTKAVYFNFQRNDFYENYIWDENGSAWKFWEDINSHHWEMK